MMPVVCYPIYPNKSALAVVPLFHQRINAEKANEPLIEQQFVHEFMRFGASGSIPWHFCLPSSWRLQFPKCVQLNCERSACTISMSGKISAMRIQWCRCRLLHPLPYAWVNCSDRPAINFFPYSALSFLKISVFIRLPICQYNKVISAFTANATFCLLCSISTFMSATMG